MTAQPDARLTTPSVIALAQALHDDDRAPDMPQALAAARYVLAVHARELADMQRAAMRADGYDLDCVCGACSACLTGEYVDQVAAYADALEAPAAAARPDDTTGA